MTVIDLNSDLGEGYGIWRLGDDEALLDVVTSANVACGFHAGDPRTMRRVCAAAVERGVVIGAQVGYHDLAGFGRRNIEIAPADLENDVLYQLGALDSFARVAGGRVRYVKPHGALYNATVHDEGQATAVVEAVRRYDGRLAVLGLPGSRLLALAAAAGLTAVPEAFADRAYEADGSLVPRSVAGSVLDDPPTVVARAIRMVADGSVEAGNGSEVTVHPRSLCVHGDTPGAVSLARLLRSALDASGFTVAPFAVG